MSAHGSPSKCYDHGNCQTPDALICLAQQLLHSRRGLTREEFFSVQSAGEREKRATSSKIHRSSASPDYNASVNKVHGALRGVTGNVEGPPPHTSIIPAIAGSNPEGIATRTEAGVVHLSRGT